MKKFGFRDYFIMLLIVCFLIVMFIPTKPISVVYGVEEPIDCIDLLDILNELEKKLLMNNYLDGGRDIILKVILQDYYNRLPKEEKLKIMKRVNDYYKDSLVKPYDNMH